MKKVISGVVLSLMFFMFFAAPALVQADSFSSPNLQAPTATQVESLTSLMELVETIVNWITIFVLAIAVLMLIIAGFMWMTAGGSQDKVDTARRMLIYSLIGIAIVVAAQGLVMLIKNVLGA